MQPTLLAALAAALLCPALVLAQPVQQPAPQGRADTPGPGVWDLTALFASDAAWDQERLAVLGEIPKLGAARGTLGG
ncbi:MAG: hypothetical protein H7Z19_06565, partial [Chitinophagaceae bacterium]|nr:hypothetical protein [Rubrivivax sp.]